MGRTYVFRKHSGYLMFLSGVKLLLLGIIFGVLEYYFGDVLGSGFTTFALWVLALAGLYFFVKVFLETREYYVVDFEEEVVEKIYRFITERREQIPFIDINDISIRQNPIERLWNVGDVVMEQRDGDPIIVYDVKSPGKMAKILNTARKKALEKTKLIYMKEK